MIMDAYDGGRDLAVRVTACRGLAQAAREHCEAFAIVAPSAAWDKAFAQGESDALINMVFARESA